MGCSLDTVNTCRLDGKSGSAARTRRIAEYALVARHGTVVTEEEHVRIVLGVAQTLVRPQTTPNRVHVLAGTWKDEWLIPF